MICDVISTGSKGNAVVLNEMILLDCGVPYKLLEPYVRGLKLVLLTHVHGDHFNPSTIRRLHKERPTLRFGCCEWMVEPLLLAGVSATCIDVYVQDLVYSYGITIAVSPFWLAHDVQNCGYRIFDADGNKALYATDTGSLEGVVAKDYDIYMIEANHTEAEIAERIKRKTDAGEFVYEYRAVASHLSKEKADAWLAQNATPAKSRVVYLHQHQDENERS